MIQLTQLHRYKENNRLEVKKASHKLPSSLWETYSSFANSQGGVILLGITETPSGELEVTGTDNIETLLKDFWNTVNNPQKVSLNLLTDKHIHIFSSRNRSGIAIEIPRATRNQRPIYINNNILNGSYRRNHEGDYHCSSEEIKNMLRDQADTSQDTRLLENFDLDALDLETLKRYRNRMASQKPGHVWQDLSDKDFLYRIGAAGCNKETHTWHPTAAGLLMFGFEYEIIKEFGSYFLDYQEKMDDATRWTDRIVSSSGDWSGNLYDFFFRVYPKLSQEIKTPFRLKDGLERIDDTSIHTALREALVNALIHSCYYERMGIVIKKTAVEIIIENPGSLRMDKEIVLRGGNSDPRNSTLMKIFNLINIGERSGSGVPNILKTWEQEGFLCPQLKESFNPDRTTLILPLKKSEAKIGSKNRKQKSEAKIGSKTEIALQNILDFLTLHDSASRMEIEEFLELGTSRTAQLLQLLTKQNKIDVLGSSRNRRYKVVKNNSRFKS